MSAYPKNSGDTDSVTIPLDTDPTPDGDGDGDDMPTNLGDICPDCEDQPGR